MNAELTSTKLALAEVEARLTANTEQLQQLTTGGLSGLVCTYVCVLKRFAVLHDVDEIASL